MSSTVAILNLETLLERIAADYPDLQLNIEISIVRVCDLKPNRSINLPI